MSDEIEALSLPPARAIAFFDGKVNVPTQRWTDVWKAAHDRGFMVAGVQAEDLLGGIRTAIAKALREGTTLAEFRRDLTPLLQRLGWEARGKGYLGWRTRLVYETNLRSAYAAGAYEQATDPDVLAALPFWRYRHSGARDPRPEHQAWDGTVLRAEDPWWQTHHPPNGWGCGCWVEPLSPRDLERLGKAGPDEAPPVLTRPWTNPTTGQAEQVPLGIDPGWDYNVGASWRQASDLAPAPQAPPAGFGGNAPRARLLPMRTEARRDAVPVAVRERDTALRSEQASWRGSLSAEEIAAIGRYRGRLGQAINRELRGERQAAPGVSAVAAQLSSAVARAALVTAQVVRRGASAREAAALGAAGDEGAFRAFVSTSIAAEIAAGFARRRNGTVIELRLPAGLVGAAYVQGVSGEAPQQYELLLAPGLRYRVLRRAKRLIVLEVRGGRLAADD